jgi:hypothetical protein
MFKQLEGETAILKIGGVFKVADLYEREGKLFAAAAGGYVRLYANGSTSKDKLGIDALALDAPLYVDQLGRLCVSFGEGRTLLDDQTAGRLRIGGPS